MSKVDESEDTVYHRIPYCNKRILSAYCYTREDAARIPEAIASGCGIDAPGSLVAWLASKVPVHAMEMPGKRFDIGDLKSYEAVKEIFDNNKTR